MEQLELLGKLNTNTGLPEIQKYMADMIELRGFRDETIQDIMLLLLEETGELAKAVRKSSTSIPLDPEKLHNYTDVEDEIADVFVMLLSACNFLGIDMFEAFVRKEKANCSRKWV